MQCWLAQSAYTNSLYNVFRLKVGAGRTLNCMRQLTKNFVTGCKLNKLSFKVSDEIIFSLPLPNANICLKF